jgi:hypothetical protein
MGGTKGQSDGLRRLLRLAAAALVAGVMIAVAAGPSRASDATAFETALVKMAPPPSGEALEQIPDPGRKLLALRSYLRSGSRIAERWSWTADEIKAFEGSPEQKALLAEVDAVKQHFKAANPGYEIYVHATIRSLDEQIAKWNSNESVGVAAQEILAAYRSAFADEALAFAGVEEAKLAAWLRSFKPSKRANLAAPGMTLHGRASAIDFQVMKDGRIYAGADTKKVESVWRAEGWDQKLKASISAAGPSFTGPLTDPDEPWHYDYSAKPVDGQVSK